MSAHSHPRCDDCRKMEEKWLSVLLALDRERQYNERLIRENVWYRDFLERVYQQLPSRRTKLAKAVLEASFRPPEGTVKP